MTMASSERSNSTGLTLLELAIALTLIGLIAGMGLSATLGILESARRAQTENKLDAIERSIETFRDQFDRLPCPSDITVGDTSSDYGLEAANAGECTGGSPAAADVSGNDGYHYLDGWPPAVSGGVPVKALGLPNEFTRDGWGRRITYVVDAHATASGAFNLIPPDANNCSLRVLDDGGGYRSGSDARGGAIYALVSHGSNGHGAYVSSGSRVSAGSTNAAEHVNCRCDSAGQSNGNSDLPYLVQRAGTENPDDSTDGFDDIVRFKERWQLQNDADHRKRPMFPEYQLIVAMPFFLDGDPPNVAYYKRACDGWVQSRNQSDFASAIVPGVESWVTTIWLASMEEPGGESWATIMELVLSPDNRYLHFYYDDTHSLLCQSYDLLAGSEPVGVPGCVALYDGSSRIAMSRNGYLVFGTLTGTEMYRVTGTQFVRLTDCFSPPSDAPSHRPIVAALSNDADYMMLTDRIHYASVYGKVADGAFRKLAAASQPVTANYNRITAIAFSPDDRFLAIGESGINRVTVWRVGAGSLFGTGDSPFTELTTMTASYAPAAIAFSPDGSYMAVRLDISDTSVDRIVKIYKIDGDVFTEATVSNSGRHAYFDPPESDDEPYLLAFSPDSRMLVLSHPGCCIVTLDRVDSLTFQQNIPMVNVAEQFGVSGGPFALAVYH